MQKQNKIDIVVNLFGIPREYFFHYLAIALLLLGLLIWEFAIWECIIVFWEWINAENVVTKNEIEVKEVEAIISRNRGFFILALIGIVLTIWGRVMTNKQNKQEQEKIEKTGEEIKVSREANINDRYKAAAEMLDKNSMLQRIAGCRTLLALARDDKSMLSSCSGLLLFYITKPYLYDDDKELLNKKMKEFINDYEEIYLEKYEGEQQIIQENSQKSEYDSNILIKIFNVKKELRPDIQETINAISEIYQQAYDIGEDMNDRIISLPSYFWQNQKKYSLCFAHGNFDGQDMQEAYLPGANLQSTDLKGANLQNAELQHADLKGANLQNTDLKGANLRNAKLQNANLEGANLQNADLKGANLENANLSYADIANAILEDVKELTKQQILSAGWAEINERGSGEAPFFSVEFMEDEAIREWRESPAMEWENDEWVIRREKWMHSEFFKNRDIWGGRSPIR